MKRIALTAALVSALAVPALADTQFTVDHFNASVDNAGDRIVLQDSDNSVTVSTRSGALADVIALINGSANNAGDMIQSAQSYVASSTPAYGAEIFAAERARASGADL